MKNYLCKQCGKPYMKRNVTNLYCTEKCFLLARRQREYRKRSWNDDDTPQLPVDGNIHGNGNKVNWVEVLYCPKDHPDDDLPPFTPRHSRFPFDQFLVGLALFTWPAGMKIRVNMSSYVDAEGNKRKKLESKHEYVVPRSEEQGLLATRIRHDAADFFRRVNGSTK